MASSIKGLFGKLSLGGGESARENGFSRAGRDQLFPQTDPAVDGDGCLHDCESCTIKYPRRFTIDTSDQIYGNIKGWETHLIVATGKTDWVRDVADEKGSIMEAVDRSRVQPTNGKLKLSASDMPLPHELHSTSVSTSQSQRPPTTVLLLPAFVLVDNVVPANVPDLIATYVNACPTNTSPLPASPPLTRTTSRSPPAPASPPSLPPSLSTPQLTSRPCPHAALILLCSHKTRDARCGQSAPLLRREFERHLRPLGLARDLHDERAGGVGIYFINHVGGHKYSANVLLYRRAGAFGDGGPPTKAADGGEKPNEAMQCIWLARVRPEDCENIVRYTILKGKVVKPDRQLRGGFDRCKQLVSW
ncbi:Sucrase/ferredoxin-like-domain-containing protein [Lineolata rhizophorae]|uniref:Sucrase/ferredoxin-like-domain-containing protein n=1 Tax=Lineolata rhizophorae TaxID=578093 RepID=A0A6A6NLH1_9PEZI|nr:Sucrase/ferredoxin-like-domain-containing protein [Lineolata rhizophorae]